MYARTWCVLSHKCLPSVYVHRTQRLSSLVEERRRVQRDSERARNILCTCKRGAHSRNLGMFVERSHNPFASYIKNLWSARLSPYLYPHARSPALSLHPVPTSRDKMTTLLVDSPLYPVMVKQARETMKKTAEVAGIDWEAEVSKLGTVEDLEAAFAEITGEASSEWSPEKHLPAYFRAKFHAYSAGNLCWEAALEQLVAGKAVGVRNFPAFGKDGEDQMRSQHEAAMLRLGAYVPSKGSIVDLGCGTGTSSRRLAALYPQVGGRARILISRYG
jgi:hypothetical protein